jgi:hypothetical protein
MITKDAEDASPLVASGLRVGTHLKRPKTEVFTATASAAPPRFAPVGGGSAYTSEVGDAVAARLC